MNNIKYNYLHIEDEIFRELRNDTNFVLQRLISVMTRKDAPKGKITINIDVGFRREELENTEFNADEKTRIACVPVFEHKVSSVVQIKEEQKGYIDCDDMEMVFNDKTNEYVLKYIRQPQMSIFDMDDEEDDDDILSRDMVFKNLR